MNPNITLKLTAAIIIGGVLCRPGALVEVTESEAKDLLRRGKATLATAADQGPPLAAITNGEDGTMNVEIKAFNAALFDAASEDNPVDAQIEVAGNLVDVKVIGLDSDTGAPIVTDASSAALEAATLRDQADKAVASAAELTRKARSKAHKAAAENATAAAADAVAAAEAAEAKAAELAG